MLKSELPDRVRWGFCTLEQYWQERAPYEHKIAELESRLEAAHDEIDELEEQLLESKSDD